MSELPSRLDKPPLIEAVFEIRFSSRQESVGELLPGLFYGNMKPTFSKAEPLPEASIPAEVRKREPNLKYRAQHRLSREGETLLLGDHVVALSKSPPYAGWSYFRELAAQVVEIVAGTDLVESIERFSFKCVNLIEYGDGGPFDPLEATLDLAGLQIRSGGLLIRAESELDGFTNVIEIGSTMAARIQDETKTGVMLAIDTIRPVENEEFITSAMEQLDAAHDTLKSVFFRLVSEETVQTFGPHWEH